MDSTPRVAHHLRKRSLRRRPYPCNRQVGSDVDIRMASEQGSVVTVRGPTTLPVVGWDHGRRPAIDCVTGGRVHPITSSAGNRPQPETSCRTTLEETRSVEPAVT